MRALSFFATVAMAIVRATANFFKPHPRPTLSLAQAESIRKWFEHLGINP